MKILPALDLQKGRVVQLVGGVRGTQQISLTDPVAVAQDWERNGARALHIIDLDAAFDDGSNAETIRSILSATRLEVQLGGGIRTTAQAETWLSAGARRIIVGTRALTDPAWLRTMTDAFPGRVIAAVDSRNGRAVTHGWTRSTPHSPESLAAALDDLPLAGILATCVDVEGHLEGVDRGFAQRIIQATSLPVLISGGVTTLEDIRFLRDAGAHAAIIGLALYTGRLDLASAQRAAEETP